MPSPQAHNSRSKPTKTKSAKTFSIPISWTQLSKLIFFIFIPRRYYRYRLTRKGKGWLVIETYFRIQASKLYPLTNYVFAI